MIRKQIVSCCVLGIGVSAAFSEEVKSRYYLGIGEPNPDAWQIMVDNPTGREKDIGVAVAALGSEMIGYFWGLADGKKYVTLRLPDDPGIVKAVYVSRLSQGVLKDYRFIELVTSADIANAFEPVPDFATPVE
ncbi:hypothetical protein GS636_01395 [Ruegeria sp. HKCCD4884]|uniref:hypothetical protein n=1 Tax=Ruegeria sp. HKCCD4884 TaxID=2683022 RepID=UPI001491B913|nr:hypothetical protein [Ruegeria sp. HKCCD4884]NOD91436.1 hypothetical protein [Ruegeria sp. HKCCD4884]